MNRWQKRTPLRLWFTSSIWKWDQAEQEYQRAISLNPTIRPRIIGLGFSYIQGNGPMMR